MDIDRKETKSESKERQTREHLKTVEWAKRRQSNKNQRILYEHKVQEPEVVNLIIDQLHVRVLSHDGSSKANPYADILRQEE